MKATHKRFAGIAVTVLCIAAALWLITSRFGANMTYFYSPSDITALRAENSPVLEKRFRAGGLVEEDSVTREGLQSRFSLTDGAASLTVAYEGLLPTLFREGQGIVATGKLKDDVLEADELLAKHDENYMPPDVADALQRAKTTEAP